MTSSLTMEVEVVAHAIQWLASQRDAQITHAITLTDSKNLLQKVESGMGCPDWHTAMHSLRLQRLLWIYCPGHARVSGNERADRLARTADITSGLQLGQGRGAPRFEELSEHRQVRESQHWSLEGKRSGERKWPTFHPPRSRTICVQPGIYWHYFKDSLGETAERQGEAHMGIFRALRCHLELKLKLKLIEFTITSLNTNSHSLRNGINKNNVKHSTDNDSLQVHSAKEQLSPFFSFSFWQDEFHVFSLCELTGTQLHRKRCHKYHRHTVWLRCVFADESLNCTFVRNSSHTGHNCRSSFLKRKIYHNY